MTVPFKDGSTRDKKVTIRIVKPAESEKYTVGTGSPVDVKHGVEIKVGDAINPSAVAINKDGNPVGLPAGAKVVWTEVPDTSEIGDGKTGKAKVIFADGTESDPVDVTYNVVPNQADEITPAIPEKQPAVDVNNLTDAEKDAVKQAVEEANPTFPDGTNVEVGNDGTATVTYPDGSKDTIPGTDLVRPAKDNEKYTAETGAPVDLVHGKDVKVGDELDSSAVVIKDKNGNQAELPAGSKVVWTEAPDTSELGEGKTGQAKIVYGDGTESEPVTVTYNVVSSQADKTTPATPEKQPAVDVNNLTEDEKDKVKQAVEDANPTFPEDTVVEVGNDGTATITYPDGSKDTIPGTDLVRPAKDNEKYNAETGTPVDLVHGKDVKVGDELDPSAVVIKDKNGVPVELPAGSKVVWTEVPDTSELSEGKTGQAKIVYGDGTESDPVDVTYNVVPNQADINNPVAGEISLKQREALTNDDAAKTITNLTDLPEGTTVAWKPGTTIDTNTPGNKQGTVVVNYPDGSSEEVEVTVHVKGMAEEYAPEGGTVDVKKGDTATNSDAKKAIY